MPKRRLNVPDYFEGRLLPSVVWSVHREPVFCGLFEELSQRGNLVHKSRRGFSPGCHSSGRFSRWLNDLRGSSCISECGVTQSPLLAAGCE